MGEECLNECGKRVDGGVDRISQLPDEILLVILSILRLKEAAATSVLSSRWSDLWKHIPNLRFDRISQLPNQIVTVILSLLSLKEAAATSVLSSRWSDAWKHTPNLEFDKHIFTPEYESDDGVWEQDRCEYIEIVNSVIESHKALSLKKFRIDLRVQKSDKSIVAKWLKFVFSRQVESLELDFQICPIRSNVFVLEESLREESVRSMAPETLIFFQYLKRLCVTCLIVSGEDIKFFVQNCSFLEQLMIHFGTLTSDVEICGENLMLKHLDISHCKGGKFIKVSAPNLTRIRFMEAAGTLSFENVPKLVNADFKLKGSLFAIQHLVFPASCYISQLQSLVLTLSRPKVLWTSGFPKMPNLKKLAIYSNELYKHSLLPFTSIIWSSPRLEEIKLKFTGILRDPTAWMGAVTNVERSLHQHLKVFAFQMCSRKYWAPSDHIGELVSYILDNCVALQKIIIGSPFNKLSSIQLPAKMQADKDDLTQQLQAKVPNHIQLELPYSIDLYW